MQNTKLVAGLSVTALAALGVITVFAMSNGKKLKAEEDTKAESPWIQLGHEEKTSDEYTGNLFASSSLLSALYINVENNERLSEQTGSLICSEAGMSEAMEGYSSYIAHADTESGNASVEALDVAQKFVPERSVIEGYTNLGISNVTTYLNIREGVGTDHAVIGKMPGGSACEILAEKEGWYQIRSGEVEGYVDKQYILTGYAANTVAMELINNVLRVNTDHLNVRSRPSTDSSVVVKVNTGDILEILAQAENGWYQIQINGDEGYVAEEYVDNIHTLPTAEKLSGAGRTAAAGSGNYLWPLSDYTSISSYFNIRSNPFGGSSTEFHNGIDIPAPSGTSVMAVSDGWVAWSSYSSSAGNWIGIDHGNGVYSIYMHMSSRIAQAGDSVSAGQVIGKVGSTGRSTGAHLHLGICIDETYVNPLDYVSP